MNTGIELLKRQPIEFNEAAHTYRWLPTNELMGASVTEVCSVNKTQSELYNIKKHRSSWEPRGKHIHAVAAAKQQRLPFEIKPDYLDWANPMLAHPFWKTFEPLAVEYAMCDLRRGIGGTLDSFGIDHLTGKKVLVDLKSQSRAKARPYSTDVQMGGYLSMLIPILAKLKRLDLSPDECLTLWVRPGKCVLGDPQDPDECLMAWEDSYEKWTALQDWI